MKRKDGYYIVEWKQGAKGIVEWEEGEWLVTGWGTTVDDREFSYIAPEPLDLDKLKDSYTNK